MEMMKWVINQMPKTDDRWLPVMALPEIQKAKAFHESFPQYACTPLVKLDEMARYLGVKEIYVKDESYRFGLNAFKVLGGSFAIACYIAKIADKSVAQLPYSVLTSEKFYKEFEQITFYTATDGNHGKSVAWTARKFHQKAVVHMPVGTTRARLENILGEGASADITDFNYDDCVRLAAKEAEETSRGAVIQDTAWEGYEEIPTWIMQGYGTMAMEADGQLKAFGCERPTHVFIQAGVGSLAGAVIGYFTNLYRNDPPIFVVVEAEAAACFYKGAAANDGEIRIVDGNMQTIMAGLACGEPNIIAWDILKNHVKAFIAVPDWTAIKGMRMLAAPLRGDAQVVSGESGAAAFGALAALASMEDYITLKESIGLDENSKVLLFSTEGDTDPKRYKNIVWEGKMA